MHFSAEIHHSYHSFIPSVCKILLSTPSQIPTLTTHSLLVCSPSLFPVEKVFIKGKGHLCYTKVTVQKLQNVVI